MIVGAIALAYFSSTSVIIIVIVAIIFVSSSLFIQNIQQPFKLRFNNSQDREKAYISYVVQVTKLVDDAIHAGEFDGMGNSITCLGNYTGDCYPTISGMIPAVQLALEGIGTIPEGQVFPYGGSSYGTWMGPQVGSVLVGTYLDASGSYDYLCNQFNWKNVAFGSVAGGRYCFTSLPR